jgi:hypothetical protein
MNGVLQVRCLGRMGRWGNAIFQYAAGKVLARRFDLQLQVPPWVGDVLYGFKDVFPDRPLRLIREKTYHGRDDAIIPNLHEPLCDVDIEGYFQYHTGGFYAPDRDFIQSLFAKPVDAVLGRVARAAERLRSLGREAIGVHIRRGDYGRGIYYITPIEWYVELLERIVTPESVVFVATEDATLLAALAKFEPVTARSLGVELSSEPLPGLRHLRKDIEERNAAALDFFPDWYLLQQCSTVVMPNSTFSFTAAWTSTACKRAFRSEPDTQRFEEIDVWDAMPAQFVRQEDYQHVPGMYLKENPYW